MANWPDEGILFMKILVTGGAGYIGSIMTKRLLDDGHDVTVLDSIERGKESVVDDRAELVVENLCNRNFVRKFLEENTFDAVVHFAAFISMAESMQDPYIYFYNNVMGSLVLIEEMVKAGTNNLIFSSTAGVYGNPTTIPIPEDHDKKPTNPYGESKLMVERILEWYNKIHNFNSVALRYFNAAGATTDASLGEQHIPETHIIPNVIHAVLNNKPFTLFGKDYETSDGTCVRDYIHVLDLVEAHLLAINKLMSEPGQYVYNVGTGKGYSNKEVVEIVQKISGKNIEVSYADRRPGDAAVLVADVAKIKNELGFIPRHSDLETIVATAWRWHTKNE